MTPSGLSIPIGVRAHPKHHPGRVINHLGRVESRQKHHLGKAVSPRTRGRDHLAHFQNKVINRPAKVKGQRLHHLGKAANLRAEVTRGLRAKEIKAALKEAGRGRATAAETGPRSRLVSPAYTPATVKGH